MHKPIAHKDDVFTIENFLSKEECEKIIQYLEMSVQNGYIEWNQISFYESYAMGFWDYDNNLELFGLDSKYFNQLKEKIKLAGELCFSNELSEISYHTQKWVEGAFASFHSDNSDDEGNPTAFQRSKYAIFLYLNEDFEGGKLNFKNYDITIEPKTGLIAIFKGGHGNEHEVTQVKSGTRYTIGSFWDDANAEYDEETKKAWADELAKVRAEQDVMYEKWSDDKSKGIVPTYYGKNEK
jgi:hypothetical protein